MTPRFYGIVITLFLSTVLADVLALLGASVAGKVLLGVDPVVFYNGLTSGLLGIGDVVHGLIKSAVFGVAIALSSCHYGLATEGGAPGAVRFHKIGGAALATELDAKRAIKEGAELAASL